MRHLCLRWLWEPHPDSGVMLRTCRLPADHYPKTKCRSAAQPQEPVHHESGTVTERIETKADEP